MWVRLFFWLVREELGRKTGVSWRFVMVSRRAPIELCGGTGYFGGHIWLFATAFFLPIFHFGI